MWRVRRKKKVFIVMTSQTRKRQEFAKRTCVTTRVFKR